MTHEGVTSMRCVTTNLSGSLENNRIMKRKFKGVGGYEECRTVIQATQNTTRDENYLSFKSTFNSEQFLNEMVTILNYELLTTTTTYFLPTLSSGQITLNTSVQHPSTTRDP